MNVALNIEPRRALYLVFGALIAIYLALNFGLPSLPGGFVTSYVVRPLIWVSLAVLVLKMPAYMV